MSDDDELWIERSIIEELVTFDGASPWRNAHGVWHKQMDTKTPGYGLTVLGYGTVTLRKGENQDNKFQDNLYTGLINGDNVEHLGDWWITVRIHEKLDVIGGMKFHELVTLLRKPRMRKRFKLPPLGE